MNSNYLSRRHFIRTAAAAAVASPLIGSAGEKKLSLKSETLVTTLYKSLNEEQRKIICMPFDHELRSKVDNNWHVTKPRLGKDFTKDQQQMVKEIFLGLHSNEWADKVYGQVKHDSGKAGFGDSSIAIFGEPDTGKFEFVLTGRHCTRRCDGDSVEGAAFGGPIFYGHAAGGFDEKPDHPNNVYWYQAERANSVFKMLDGKQRKMALVDGPGRKERRNKTVALTGKKEGLDGIRLSEFSRDQKDEVDKVLSDLLAPFRKEDREESMKLIRAGGMDNLHMAFYQQSDVGSDKVWDNWQLEGPNIVWYFRGDPHVHVWAHIKKPA